MVGDRGVEMVVGDVRLDVEARRERRIVDHEPGRIIALEPGEGLLQPLAVVGVMDEVDAPVLVDDRPDDDRRVVAVAVDDSLEEPLLAAAGALGRHAAVRQLGPDQHADPVGDLVVARVRRLDVAAQAVEAELLRLAELVFEEFHRRHGADRVRIVVLVEGAPEIERLTVEVELAVAGLDGAKAEALLDGVERRPAPQHLDPHPIEVRRLRRPGPDLADPEFERHACGAGHRRHGEDEERGVGRVEHLDPEVRRLCERARENSHPGDLAGLALRHDARLLHVIGDAALEMDRLPDARERPVPALLAERDLGEGRIGEFGRVVGRAVDPDLDLVLAWPQMLRHVEGERQEPALVRSDERAVHPDPGIVEHRPEAQPDVIGEPLGRDVDEPAIDADAGPHAQIRELRLPGRRHVDGAHRCRPGRAIVGDVQELPGSIEAETGGGHYGSFGASPRWRPRRRTQVTADVFGQAGSSRRPRIACKPYTRRRACARGRARSIRKRMPAPTRDGF